MINEKTLQTISYAITDKELTANDFRLLVLIATKENVTHTFLKKIGIIKHSNTISESYARLLSNHYIEKEKTKGYYTKGVSTYQYSVNTNKALLPFNSNSFLGHTDAYFQRINELFEYFYSKLPQKKAVSVISAKKSLGMLLDFDGLSSAIIKQEIDFISDDLFLKSKITSPAKLRQYLKLKRGK